MVSLTRNSYNYESERFGPCDWSLVLIWSLPEGKQYDLVIADSPPKSAARAKYVKVKAKSPSASEAFAQCSEQNFSSHIWPGRCPADHIVRRII